jgi:hypothetical protein
MLALLAVSRGRPRLGIVSGVLVGSMIYHCFLFFRDTPVTWFEAANFLTFAVMVVSYGPVLLVATRARRTALALAALAAATLVLGGAHYVQRHFIPYLAALNRAQAQAAAALAGYGDRIAFLVPDNSYLTLTVDSAIFKGGSNILEGPRFGKSALIRGIYPYRWYFTESPAYYDSSPIDLGPYRAVVFVVRKGLDPEPEGQLALMSARYGPGLSGLALRSNVDFGDRELLVWSVDRRNGPGP